ncbi:unnamed protein product [Phyllotreta striolata]|uniref:Uncharacterized protein n=1 Tax=Phyllotreta striolata TaxID=444603 RepID=A0A9N9XM34_PHYSR|nr:unnamed protein product [Phyllotreta striolata]
MELSIAFLLSALLVVAASSPSPGIVDGVARGLVDGVANRVVNDLAETAEHLLNGALIGGHHGEHSHGNLPLRDIIGHVRDLFGIEEIHGTSYCSCPNEESYSHHRQRYRDNYESNKYRTQPVVFPN